MRVTKDQEVRVLYGKDAGLDATVVATPRKGQRLAVVRFAGNRCRQIRVDNLGKVPPLMDPALAHKWAR